MTAQDNDTDLPDLDTEILERIKAYQDAKEQAQHSEGVNWIGEELLDYSLRGLEALK